MARQLSGSILSRVQCLFCGCDEVMVMNAEMEEDMPPSASVILESGDCAHQFTQVDLLCRKPQLPGLYSELGR